MLSFQVGDRKQGILKIEFIIKCVEKLLMPPKEARKAYSICFSAMKVSVFQNCFFFFACQTAKQDCLPQSSLLGCTIKSLFLKVKENCNAVISSRQKKTRYFENGLHHLDCLKTLQTFEGNQKGGNQSFFVVIMSVLQMLIFLWH